MKRLFLTNSNSKFYNKLAQSSEIKIYNERFPVAKVQQQQILVFIQSKRCQKQHFSQRINQFKSVPECIYGNPCKHIFVNPQCRKPGFICQKGMVNREECALFHQNAMEFFQKTLDSRQVAVFVYLLIGHAGKFAVACNPEKGPIFGCCNICIVDQSNQQKSNAQFPISYNNFKYSRNNETSIAFTGNSKGKFCTKEWEVFQANFQE